jgi:hypothetical protein
MPILGLNSNAAVSADRGDAEAPLNDVGALSSSFLTYVDEIGPSLEVKLKLWGLFLIIVLVRHI